LNIPDNFNIDKTLYSTMQSTLRTASTPDNSRKILIKTYSTENMHPSMAAQIMDKFEAVKSIQSSAVPNVADIIRTDTSIELIMDLPFDTTLYEFMKKGKTDTGLFLQIASQLAEITGDLHRKGHVMRRIIPSNILIKTEPLEIKFTDFCLHTETDYSETKIFRPDLAEKILPYISPEQTDRGTAPPDEQSDIYSLGIIFYELITGNVPFRSDDPFEITGMHKNDTPVPPVKIISRIPAVISDIILKLLEKNPDNRYHSCEGINEDLSRCLTQFQSKGTVKNFKPGLMDIPEKFHISGKYYGRDNELGLLTQAFSKALSGIKEFVCVSGPSGIGKTTVIQEMFRPRIHNRCLFITGKCDQLREEMPYNPLILAFQELIRSILNEPGEIIQIWRESILESLGTNGQIIIDVIPEIEKIIGSQEKIQELGSRESQNRFNLVFTNFIKVFSDPKRPLVIFMDDLQWVDPATLLVIKSITTDPEIKSIFFLGSYRDNEVTEFHSLSLAVNEIKKAGVPVIDIHVDSIEPESAQKLVSDTFKCSAEKAETLSKFAYTRTHGNPLLINQFLKSLHERKMIHFNHAEGWIWDISSIKSAFETDSMASLMALKISRLEQSDQDILKYASCIGSTFDLLTLSRLMGQDMEKILPRINRMIDEGFIVPSWDEYRFLHDRIYESATEILDIKERSLIHYRIGKLLLKHSSNEQINENIFIITNHLNLGKSHITRDMEKYELAKFNLKAGIKARLSVAYESAANHILAAGNILPQNSWADEYDLSIKIYMENFLCSYLTGDMEKSYSLFVDIMKNSGTNLEKAGLYNLNTMLLMNSSKPSMAIDLGIEGLKLLGINLSEKPSAVSLAVEKRKLSNRFKNGGIDSILNLPEMKDPGKIRAMDILLNIWMPANLSNPELRTLITIKMVNSSLKYGNCDISSFGYMAAAMIIGSEMGDYSTADALAHQAMKLNDKYGNTSLVSRNDVLYGSYLAHFRNHANTNIRYLKEGYRKGNESGDFYYAGVAAIIQSYTMVMKGDPLDNVYRTARKYLDFSMKIKNFHVSDALIIILRIIKLLRGETHGVDSLSDDKFHEESFINSIKEKEVIQPLYMYRIFKSRTLYLFEEYSEALSIIPPESEIYGYHFSTLLVPEQYFMHSLAITAVFEELSFKEKIRYMYILRKNMKKLKKWADNSPENFLHKYLIISAEINRIRRKGFKAIKLYNKAIRSAAENGYTNNLAIANELAGKFYISTGFNETAASHLNAALQSYIKWGATAKVSHMKSRYSEIQDADQKSGRHKTEKAESGSEKSLINTFVKQVADEDHLPGILRQIINASVRISGADKAYIVLKKQNRYTVEAEKNTGSDEIRILRSLTLTETDILPVSIIKHVSKTGKYLFINFSEDDMNFGTDPFIVKNTPACIICTPVTSRDETVGIVYLEINSPLINSPETIHDNLYILMLQASESIWKKLDTLSEKTADRADRTHLKDLDTDAILEKLNMLMEKEKLYNIEDFTLSMMSQELGITNIQLSELLNDRLNVNFNTFINKHRINEAKKILIQDPDRSVISIAYEVGFNSISPFYNAFLKFTGKSPAKYRKDKTGY